VLGKRSEDDRREVEMEDAKARSGRHRGCKEKKSKSSTEGGSGVHVEDKGEEKNLEAIGTRFAGPLVGADDCACQGK
jgi:hypothetical protein